MGGQRAERPQAVAVAGLAVLTGAEAVARSARRLVGDAVARDPAVAEGLALSGVRAASVTVGALPSSPGESSAGAASCVHHVTVAPGRDGRGSFELAATSAQEAVDDGLAAHLLSQRLGRPGVCSIAPKLASRLAVVQLPEPGDGAQRLAAASRSQELAVDPDRIAELAREALAEASTWLGRPMAPVVTEGDEQAELVLVAAGDGAASARVAVRALAEAGVPARVAIVRLVRPFPTELVRKALAGARVAVAVGAPDEPVHWLLAAVRAAAGEGTEVRGVTATGSARLIEALREVLPVCGFDVSQLATAESPALEHRLVIAPDSPWGEDVARQALVQLVAGGAPLRLGRLERHHLGAAVLAWSGGAVADAARDLLIASHPGALEEGALALLRPQSAVVVSSDARSGAALVQELSAATRAVLLEREHRVYWVASGDGGEATVPGDDERAVTQALAAAALAAIAHSGAEGAVAPPSSDGAIRRVDAADLAAPPAQEVDFRATSSLPRMPGAADDPEAREVWAGWLRRFHRTGAASADHAPLRAVRPAVLATLADEVRRNAMHPFVLAPDADASPPVAVSALRDTLAEALAATGREAGALEANLGRLVVAVTRALERGTPGTPLDPLLVEAGDELVSELALADEDAAGVRVDLAALRAALPAGGRVFDLRSDTPIRIYLEVLAAMRAPLERHFAQEIARLREVLRGRLQLDRMGSREGHSAQTLASEFGGGATRLLDPDALARTLHQDPSWPTIDERERQRLTAALHVIEDHLGRAQPLPRAVFVRPPGVELRVPGDPPIEHPDPLAAAVGVFDGFAHSMAPLFRALRFARMLDAGSYRPERHDELLADMDWESFTTDELFLLPAVTVVTTGSRLRRRGQSSLSALLRSSRPVHVIVRDEVAAADEAEEIALHHLDLGHLVMAHREAFAMSTIPARPRLLVEGLARMLREPRPGVVLVPLPARESTPSALLLAEAALWGRACPNFLYDPDAGASWADRFDIAANPQPECAWPVHQIAYLDRDGSERVLEAAFTFADAVALEPAYRRHLRVIPRVAWQDDRQLPLAEFIALLDSGRGARGIPFLWVVDEAGWLQRAVVSRELALACRDRLRGWRVLQELGGFENAYAERAATAAREAAEAEAVRERAELEQRHEESLANARSDGVREAMQRLAVTLLNPDAFAAVAAAPGIALPAAPAPPAAPAATATPAPSVAEPAAPEVSAEVEAPPPPAVEDPYIDTILCTSCNECTNINSRLFAYDDNKQAFIADASAGSFADLVKAAKLCPAKCIHPGKPRSGDASATPALIAQAAELN